MSNFEARIRTKFGTLTIHFNNSEEFVQRLQSLDMKTVTTAVEDHLAGVIISDSRRIKPVLAEICDFTPDGDLEFLKPPKEKLEAIGIVLYAFDPEPVEPSTVKKLAAVGNPVGYLGHKKYQGYFERVGRGLYRLSHAGKLWVTNEIIPKLTAESEKEE